MDEVNCRTLNGDVALDHDPRAVGATVRTCGLERHLHRAMAANQSKFSGRSLDDIIATNDAMLNLKLTCMIKVKRET